MVLLTVVLTSFLISREGEPSRDSEDPPEAREEVESARDDGDNVGGEQQSWGPGFRSDATDDCGYMQGSETEKGEPAKTSPPRHRAFGIPFGGSGSPTEKALVTSGFWTGLKSTIFPPQEKNRSLSNHRVLPVIAGLVIPFSILLEISGLTDSWYTGTSRSAVAETRRSPVGLGVMLIASMFSAVVANVSLICRFLEKGSVLATTLIAVVSLTIHDSVNIIALLTFRVKHGSDDTLMYGNGYWMIVCSTGVSTATNISLMWDLIWTPNFGKSGSGVSSRQRSLLVAVMLLLVFVAFGALVNSFFMGLDFIDGLYFTVVSIETIGFGDIVPKSTISRAFVCFYIIFGILNVGVAVGVARETIFEQLQVSYQRRLSKILQKYQERRDWRVWERRWKRAVEWRLREINAEIWAPDFRDDSEAMMDVPKGEPRRTGVFFDDPASRINFKNHSRHNYFQEEGEIRGIAYGRPRAHLNIEALSRAQLEAAAVESGIPPQVLRILRRRHAYSSRTNIVASQSSAPVTEHWKQWFWSAHEPLPTKPPATQFMRRLEDMSGMLTKFAIATTGVGINQIPPWADTLTQDTHRKCSLPIDSLISEATAPSDGSQLIVNGDFREIASREERKSFWAKLVVSSTLFMIFWLVGAVLFMATEKWSFGVAVYFCFITFTATGFGDYSPRTAAGKSIFVFWALLGLAAMTILVSVLQDAFSSRYKNALRGRVFKDALKKYRQETRTQWKKKAKEGSNEESRIPSMIQTSTVGGSSARAQQNLESLPEKVLEQAKLFHRYTQTFVQAGSGSVASADLKSMLEDISRSQELDERTKEEILKDESARNVLYMLVFERAVRELADTAENIRSVLAARDIITARYEVQQRVAERENPEDHTRGTWTHHPGPPS